MGTVASTRKASDLLPDDILSAVLTVAQEKADEEPFFFRGHDSRLQRIFHQLSTDPRFPLLNCFVYSDTGPIPYSPVLNESISRLQLAGLVGRENPDYEVLFLTRAARSYFDEFLDEVLTEADRQQLGAIADAFLSAVHGE